MKRSDRSGITKRSVENRELRSRVLIVCEGQKTEPNYFRSFKITNDVIVVGAGKETLAVVNEAINYVLEEGPFEHVWCVFDRDSFEAQRFNQAVQVCRHKGFKCAYSNEAFELWYVLHFDYLDVAISRSDYIKTLKKRLGGYEKNQVDIYTKLLPRQEAAIRNAKRLLGSYGSPNPEADKPSTTVHLLVEFLNSEISKRLGMQPV